MALQLRVIAADPLAGAFLVRTLSSDRELRRLLSTTSITNLDSIPQHGPPCLFVVDTFSLPLELTELTRLLRVRCPGSKFLVLVPPERSDEENILRLLHTGIEGIAKLSDRLEEELPVAVRAILAGDTWAPHPVLAEYIRQTKLLLDEQLRPYVSLTARESQILQLVIRRLSNKEIAGALRICERTVKFHIRNIFTKLRVEGRRALFTALDRVRSEAA